MKKRFILSGVSGLLFVGLIVLLRLVDVAPIGAGGTSVGLSRINAFWRGVCGADPFWYALTEQLGIVAVATALLFAAAGFLQLCKRRSLWKVDKELRFLGALYLATIALYALFERVVVNCRPILLPDELQPVASFPSSHTVLVCVTMGSAMLLLKRYVKPPVPRGVLWALCAVVIGLTVVGRLLSGAHWFTDILGGILLSVSLLALFSGLTENGDVSV